MCMEEAPDTALKGYWFAVIKTRHEPVISLMEQHRRVEIRPGIPALAFSPFTISLGLR